MQTLNHLFFGKALGFLALIVVLCACATNPSKVEVSTQSPSTTPYVERLTKREVLEKIPLDAIVVELDKEHVRFRGQVLELKPPEDVSSQCIMRRCYGGYPLQQTHIIEAIDGYMRSLGHNSPPRAALVRATPQTSYGELTILSLALLQHSNFVIWWRIGEHVPRRLIDPEFLMEKKATGLYYSVRIKGPAMCLDSSLEHPIYVPARVRPSKQETLTAPPNEHNLTLSFSNRQHLDKYQWALLKRNFSSFLEKAEMFKQEEYIVIEVGLTPFTPAFVLNHALTVIEKAASDRSQEFRYELIHPRSQESCGD